MKPTTLKSILHEQCLPALKARCAYFDVGFLRTRLKGERITFNCATLNRQQR